MDRARTRFSNCIGREGGGEQQRYGWRCHHRELSAGLQKFAAVIVFVRHGVPPVLEERLNTLNTIKSIKPCYKFGHELRQ